MSATPATEFICNCAKRYKYFSSYKNHFLSCTTKFKPSITSSNQPNYTDPAVIQQIPAHQPSISSAKSKCAFCQINIKSNKLNDHMTNICQQRYKNTQAYIELSKLGLITNDYTNKELRAICNIINKLASLQKINF